MLQSIEKDDIEDTSKVSPLIVETRHALHIENIINNAHNCMRNADHSTQLGTALSHTCSFKSADSQYTIQCTGCAATMYKARCNSF